MTRKPTYFVHFSYPTGPLLTVRYPSRRAAVKAVKAAKREGGNARLQVWTLN